MNLPDTNLWLALTLSGHQFHAHANKWFAAQSKPASILFCRATQQSFLRLLTTDAVMQRYGIPPLTNTAAWQFYHSLLADPRIAWTPESPTLDAHWHTLAARKTPSPKLWMDAYLAAFAISRKLQLVTTDQAFTQFKNLHPFILSPP